MAVSKKMGAISKDGQICAEIETYKDEKRSIARISANFKGKNGVMTFIASDSETKVLFNSDEHSINSDKITINAKDEAILNANQTVINGETDLIISSQQKLILEALKGIISLVAKGELNIGSRTKIKLQSIMDILIQASNELILKSNMLKIESNYVQIGTGLAFPVARVGDKVDTNSGVILSGSALVRIV